MGGICIGQNLFTAFLCVVWSNTPRGQHYFWWPGGALLVCLLYTLIAHASITRHRTTQPQLILTDWQSDYYSTAVELWTFYGFSLIWVNYRKTRPTTTLQLFRSRDIMRRAGRLAGRTMRRGKSCVSCSYIIIRSEE